MCVRVCVCVCDAHSHLIQNLSKMEKEAVASSGLVEELQTRCSGLCSQLSETQERLDTENTCIARLQGECTALGVVREGMDKELDRVRASGV